MEAINRFVDKIEKRDLPIDSQDGHEFAYALVESGFSAKKLRVLAEELNFIPRDIIDDQLYLHSKSLRSVLNDQPYGIIRYPAEGSAVWIYEQLISYGLPHAASVVSLDRINSEITGMLSLYQERVEDLANIYGIRSFCVMDDFGYSGKHIRKMVAMTPSQIKLNAVFVGLSKAAKAILKPHTKNIFSNLTIPSTSHLKVVATNNLECQVFGVDRRNSVYNSGFNYLTWSEIKVPDNMPRILTGKTTDYLDNDRKPITFPPLIREERFKPPYRLELPLR